jgi:hypothetical protein
LKNGSSISITIDDCNKVFDTTQDIRVKFDTVTQQFDFYLKDKSVIFQIPMNYPLEINVDLIKRSKKINSAYFQEIMDNNNKYKIAVVQAFKSAKKRKKFNNCKSLRYYRLFKAKNV